MKFILHNTRCNIIDHLVEVRDATPQKFWVVGSIQNMFYLGKCWKSCILLFQVSSFMSSDAIDIIGQTKDKSYSLSDLVGVLNHVN